MRGPTADGQTFNVGYSPCGSDESAGPKVPDSVLLFPGPKAESKSNLVGSNTHNPDKNKSCAVQTALIPLTAFQPVPLKVIIGYKYAGYQGYNVNAVCPR